jgi:hypothetical protein
MGIDIYERWIKRCREKRLSPWLSMRMNDVHQVDDEHAFLHSEFWRKNPDFRRVGYRFSQLTDRAFDYGRKEVREYHFSLLKELLERYDPDGIELDWMRFGYHFKPGFESEGTSILTAFMSDVRKLVTEAEQRRGHPVALSARVPAGVETAFGLGMDAISWARQGLIDWLVPTPFWATIDTDIPVDLWRKELDGTGVKLAPGLELIIRSHPNMEIAKNSLETVRGAAAGIIERGADRVYLFNYMDSETTISDPEVYPRILREVGSLDTMEGKPRRHVVTYVDTWVPGEPRGRLLPAAAAAGEWLEFRLLSGPAPGSGQKAAGLIFTREAVDPGEVTFFINGVKASTIDRISVPDPKPDLPHAAWSLPADAMKSGYNLIEIVSDREIVVEWVEIYIV